METILVVDDDESLCVALSEELGEVGYTVHTRYNADSALLALAQQPYDLLLLDLKMPEKDGYFVLRELQRVSIQIKVIVLTAYADIKNAVDAAKLGANDFIGKPYDFDELLLTIRRVLNSD
jgi:DNA-binding NtrC family response regulator